jgi:hypothetical protein
MNVFAALLGFAGLITVSTLPVVAAETMSGSPAMSMGGTMAKCASSNPAVIVNLTKMTYMLDTDANRKAMAGMMNHDKFVCKSTADHMGAKMVHPAMASDSMHTHM